MNTVGLISVRAGILILATVIGVVEIYYWLQPPASVPTWEEREAQVTQLTFRLKNIASEIKAFQGEGHCSGDEYCRIVGLGSKSCEGYKDFLVYSVTDAQEETLLAKVKEFNATMGEMKKLSLSAQGCGGEPAPARCIHGRCAAVAAP